MPRLDTTAEDRAGGFNRAEVFRSVAQGDRGWDDLYYPRPRAETVNSWIRYRWPNRRALAIGAPRQHLDLLISGLRGNLIAGKAYERRVGTPVIETSSWQSA